MPFPAGRAQTKLRSSKITPVRESLMWPWPVKFMPWRDETVSAWSSRSLQNGVFTTVLEFRETYEDRSPLSFLSCRGVAESRQIRKPRAQDRTRQWQVVGDVANWISARVGPRRIRSGRSHQGAGPDEHRYPGDLPLAHS